jgi:hypothetical protein
MEPKTESHLLNNVTKTPAEEERRKRTDKHLNALKCKDQSKQKTTEWLSKRKVLVTASEAASVIPARKKMLQPFFDEMGCTETEQKEISSRRYCSKYDTLNTYVGKKTGRKPFHPNPATNWGNRFEEEGRRIYEDIKKASVCEFGLQVHDTIKFLGASPDGITDDAEKDEDRGVAVEIKCPYTRAIKDVPMLEYWVQVQIVMEVFDLPAADLIELKFSVYSDKDQFLEDVLEPNQVKGVHIETSPVDCIYSPRHMTDTHELVEWAHDVLDGDSQDDEYTYRKMVCWKVDEYKLHRIKRRADWMTNALPFLNHAHRCVRLDVSRPLIPIEESPKNVMKIDISIPQTSAPMEDVDICGGSSDEDDDV